jgi:glycosyltransferase involved in cell wall biosynthesis
MRILLISQYFPPETGGTSNRLLSLAKNFQSAGHEVVVVSEKPNHPEGIIHEEYKGGLFVEREYEGIPVIYTWVHTRPEKTFWTRISFYVSFMIMAVVGAMRAKGDFDVVVASSPPLFVGLAGWAAARMKRAKFVFDVRDLWPEVAVAMGALNNPAAISLAEKVERFIYEQADGITAVTDSFCDYIEDIVGPGKPMVRVMNGTMPDVFAEDERREELRRTYGWEEKLVLLYAGNLGLAQGLPHILDAAAEFKDDERVEFVLLGSGPVRDELIARKKELGVDNVRFMDRVSLPEAAAHMAAADALLVPLGKNPIYQQFIPSKLFDSMAAGRPVLLSVDGEARAILDAAEGGLYYPAEDGTALAENIRWLLDHPEERKAMGERGRSYARTHCTRAAQADQMIDFVEQLAR